MPENDSMFERIKRLERNPNTEEIKADILKRAPALATQSELLAKVVSFAEEKIQCAYLLGYSQGNAAGSAGAMETMMARVCRFGGR